MFDMKNPLSGLQGGKANGATCMILERQSNCDKIVQEFIRLHKTGVYSIEEDSLQRAVFARYGLKDITYDEKEYIKKEVQRRIK